MVGGAVGISLDRGSGDGAETADQRRGLMTVAWVPHATVIRPKALRERIRIIGGEFWQRYAGFHSADSSRVGPVTGGH